MSRTDYRQSSSLALENSSLTAPLQHKRVEHLISVRQLNREFHGVAFDPARIDCRMAVRRLVHSYGPAVLLIMGTAPGETPFAVDSERSVYRAIRTIVINRGRAWPNLDSDVRCA